jgi:hypothetical protein
MIVKAKAARVGRRPGEADFLLIHSYCKIVDKKPWWRNNKLLTLNEVL